MKIIREIIKDSLKSLITCPSEININYDLSNNYLVYYNEAEGVAKKKNILLRNPQAKTHSHAFYSCCYLGFIIIIQILYIYMCLNHPINCLTSFLELLIPFIYVLICLYFANYIIHLIYATKTRKKGIIKLSKEGLTDTTLDGISITISWPKIKMIVLKENTVIVLTDTPIYFFVNKEVADSLTSGIKRFKSNIKIVK